MEATLCGLDGLVFTAGMGEHQPQIRAMAARHLAWLRLELEAVANMRNAMVVHSAQSRLAAYVIPTGDERVMANETLSLLQLTSETRM
nr:hypothetical protein [Rhizobium sp. P40RR-XXII]